MIVRHDKKYRVPPGKSVYNNHQKPRVMTTEVSAYTSRSIFKNKEDFTRFSCLLCNHLLQDPVQLACGHRVCQECAEKLIASKEAELQCPAEDCREPIDDAEDGAYVIALNKKLIEVKTTL